MSVQGWITAGVVALGAASIAYQARAQESVCGYQADMTDFLVAQRMAGIEKDQAVTLWKQNGPKLSDPTQQAAMGIVTAVTAGYVYQLPEETVFTTGPEMGQIVFEECKAKGGN